MFSGFGLESLLNICVFWYSCSMSVFSVLVLEEKQAFLCSCPLSFLNRSSLRLSLSQLLVMLAYHHAVMMEFLNPTMLSALT